MALDAGTDMDMVSDGYIGLEESLIDGSITMEQIDAACRRVLEAKYRLGLFADPYKYCDKNRESASIFTPGHRETAKEIATETFVLLKTRTISSPLSRRKNSPDRPSGRCCEQYVRHGSGSMQDRKPHITA